MALVVDFPRVTTWVANKAAADPRSAFCALGYEVDGELVCGVFYEDYTGSSVTATIAIEPGTMFPREFLREMFSYPFSVWDCKKIIALVADTNEKSKAFVERLGFEREAEIADYYSDGSLIVYSMIKQKCRYLENKHGQED